MRVVASSVGRLEVHRDRDPAGLECRDGCFERRLRRWRGKGDEQERYGFLFHACPSFPVG